MIWNADMISTLERMWLAGRSAGDISSELGVVSRNAVMGKVHRLGLMGSQEHNSRMQRVPSGWCKPLVATVIGQETQPEPEVVVEIVDPDLVRLSCGTIAKCCSMASGDVRPNWRTAFGLVEELTGQEYEWSRCGHRASVVAISTILGKGDPRRVLMPKLAEPAILVTMRSLALGGMVVGGRTPERWRDERTGDTSFFDDMLVVEQVEAPPRMENRMVA